MQKSIKFLIPLLCISFFFIHCFEDEPTEPEESVLNGQSYEIMYYSKREGIVNIYKLTKEGVEIPIIEDEQHQDWWPRVSPDKKTMLWYKSPKSGDYNNYEEAELWMANVDGSNQRKVLDLKDNNWTAQGVADWSPDGKELVMAATDETGHWHLFRTDTNGKIIKKLTTRNSLFGDPSWSPDGSKIVYTAYPADYTGSPINFFKLEIHTMNKDGSNEKRLTFDDERDHDPYWSPDGKEITFESQYELLHCLLGKWAVRKVILSSGETVDVVKDGNLNGVTRWSPNSDKLFFPRIICGDFAILVSTDRMGNNMETVVSVPNVQIYDCDIF